MTGLSAFDVGWLSMSRPDPRPSGPAHSFSSDSIHSPYNTSSPASPRASSPPSAQASQQTKAHNSYFSQQQRRTSFSHSPSPTSPPSPAATRRASFSSFLPPMSYTKHDLSTSTSPPAPPHAPATSSVSTATAKSTSTPPTPPKRTSSWLSNISSRISAAAHLAPHDGISFSSKNSGERSPSSESPPGTSDRASPGFFIATLRRLSTPVPSRNAVRELPAHCQCPRMVLNKNTTRERSRIKGLDGAKLRKVAFSLDVQIAPADLEEEKAARKARKEAEERSAEKREKKEKRRAEKAEKKAREEAEKTGAGKGEESKEKGASPKTSAEAVNATETKPEEKVETFRNRPVHRKRTKNPALIYTRCCELRESIPMSRLMTQLQDHGPDGSICLLDLSNETITLTDALAFSDFLTLVPVGKLILENCGLIDESVRVILAGLLAVKVPRAGMRRSTVGAGDAPLQAVPTIGTPTPADPVAATNPPNTAEAPKPPPPADSTPQQPPQPQPATLPLPHKPALHGGYITRLSLRHNPKIGRDGWNYISLFVHMCHSLRSLDLSYVPLPKLLAVRTSASNGRPGAAGVISADAASVFACAVRERLGGVALDELILDYCSPSSEQIIALMAGVAKSAIKRLCLAGNNLSIDGIAAIAQYIKTSSTIEAIDLSHNPAIAAHFDLISASLTPTSGLIALSLADTELNANTLSELLHPLTSLPRFRLLDISQNKALFGTQPDLTVQLLRRYLPACSELRKLQLSGTGMGIEHAIALCEIVPDIPKIAHLNFLENPLFISNEKDEEEGGSTTKTTNARTSTISRASQDSNDSDSAATHTDDTALFTALVAAAKCSRTLVRVDIPPLPAAAQTSDTLRALQKQVLAYCLRNMNSGVLSRPEEEGASEEIAEYLVPLVGPVTGGEGTATRPGTKAGEEELSILQQQEAYLSNAGTGIVKALGVCLGNTPTCTPKLGSEPGLSPLLASPTTPTTTSATTTGLGLGVGVAAATTAHRAHQMSVALLVQAREIRRAVEGKLAELRAAAAEAVVNTLPAPTATTTTTTAVEPTTNVPSTSADSTTTEADTATTPTPTPAATEPTRTNTTTTTTTTSDRDFEFRRLHFLHETLTNVIRKFEAEYPEHALPPSPSSSAPPAPPTTSTTSTTSTTIPSATEPTEGAEGEVEEEEEGMIRPISRRGSDLSLRSRILSFEEGRVLRRSWGSGVEGVEGVAGEGGVEEQAVAGSEDEEEVVKEMKEVGKEELVDRTEEKGEVVVKEGIKEGEETKN